MPPPLHPEPHVITPETAERANALWAQVADAKAQILRLDESIKAAQTLRGKAIDNFRGLYLQAERLVCPAYTSGMPDPYA